MRLRFLVGCLVCALLIAYAGSLRLAPKIEAQTFPIVRTTSASAMLTVGTNGLTTTAEVLRAALTAWECLVQNDPDNTTDILIGNSTDQVIQLSPGQSITIPVQDATTIQLKSVSGTPTANYLCR